MEAKEGPSKRRPRKRGDGEGSIDLVERTDTKTGSVKQPVWRGRLMVGYKPDGRPDRRAVYGKTRGEVQKKLIELRRRSDASTLGDTAMERDTIAAFLGRWLQATKATVRPKTWERYEEYVRLHLVPMLGKVKLNALRPEGLLALYASKLEAGLAPRTVHHIHTVLHTALGQAVKWGNASRNVADAVTPPATPRKELIPPTTDEVARFLDVARAEQDRFLPLWTLAVYSGCREGEMLALQWQDVDFDRASITIRRNLVGSKGGVPEYGEPKTTRSRRSVRLGPEAMEALRSHQVQQAEQRRVLDSDYAPFDLVFATQTGTPLLARNVIRAFKSALARAGLPHTIRVHDLRHASATVALAAGVHPKVVSERLGHSTIAITLDLYTHAVEGLDADAAVRMERAIRGTTKVQEPR